ncbi:MAG: cobalt ECF transporter T component CbiQ [Limisphaerales bacterium]
MKAEAELYARGRSPMHDWDARWKLVALGVLAFVSAAMDSVFAAGMALLFALVLLGVARLPVKLIWRRLAVAQIILLPCLLILPFSFGGERLSSGWWSVSVEGVRWAGLFYCRALAVLVLGLAVVYSTPMVVLLRALQSLRVPRVLVEIALLTYRYLFTLAAELTRMRWALLTRGFGARSAVQSYRPLANAVGVTLVRSVERTERIQQAMICRGFQGRLQTMQRFEAGVADVAKALVCLGGAAALLWLERGQGR